MKGESETENTPTFSEEVNLDNHQIIQRIVRVWILRSIHRVKQS
jgi:hypothetical protein